MYYCYWKSSCNVWIFSDILVTRWHCISVVDFTHLIFTWKPVHFTQFTSVVKDKLCAWQQIRGYLAYSTLIVVIFPQWLQGLRWSKTFYYLSIFYKVTPNLKNPNFISPLNYQQLMQNFTTQNKYSTYLFEHFWEVIHIGCSICLGLESLQLQMVLGHIWGTEQQTMKRALLMTIGLEHHL